MAYFIAMLDASLIAGKTTFGFTKKEIFEYGPN